MWVSPSERGHPLAGRSSRHRRSREINFFISFSSSRWHRDLSVTRPCFRFIRCRIVGPHQSPIRIKALVDISKESSSRPWQAYLPQKTVGTTPPPTVADHKSTGSLSGPTPLWLTAWAYQPITTPRRVVYLRDGTAANQVLWL